MKTIHVLGVVSLLAGLSASAKASVVNFDDLGDVGAVTTGYDGLNWDNFWFLSDSHITSNFGSNNGYIHGTVSPSDVVFNNGGGAASVSISTGTFDFNSAYLTASWNNGLSIEVDGYKSGGLLYTQTLTVDSLSATLYTFNYLGVDTVKFTSSGGVNAGYGASGEQFAMDNLTINASPIPEPATALFGAALLGVVGVSRRRSAKA